MQRRGPVAPRLRNDLGIGARQHPRRPGETRSARPSARAADPAHPPPRYPPADNTRPARGAKPHHLGRISRAPGPGQHPDRGIEPEPPRRRRQPGQHGARPHARGRLGLRGGRRPRGLPPGPPTRGDAPWNPSVWCGEGGGTSPRHAATRRAPGDPSSPHQGRVPGASSPGGGSRGATPPGLAPISPRPGSYEHAGAAAGGPGGGGAGAAAEGDGGAGEAVDGAVQCQEVFEHRRQQIEAAALPGAWFEFEW